MIIIIIDLLVCLFVSPSGLRAIILPRKYIIMSVILTQTVLTTGYTVKMMEMMDSTLLIMLKKSTSQSTSPYLEDVLH